jgi:hypothetical protein
MLIAYYIDFWRFFMKKLMVLMVAILAIGFIGCDDSGGSGTSIGSGSSGDKIPSQYQNTNWISIDSIMTITLELRVTDFTVTKVFKIATTVPITKVIYTVDDVDEGPSYWAVYHTSTKESTFYPYLYKDRLYVTAGDVKFTKQ